MKMRTVDLFCVIALMSLMCVFFNRIDIIINVLYYVVYVPISYFLWCVITGIGMLMFGEMLEREA